MVVRLSLQSPLIWTVKSSELVLQLHAQGEKSIAVLHHTLNLLIEVEIPKIACLVGSIRFTSTYDTLDAAIGCGYIWPIRALLCGGVALACQSGLNISKYDFIVLYERARMLGFSVDNVINAWKGSGMYPIDPEKVLSKLPPERPKTPEQSHYIPFNKTPKSAQDLQNSFNVIGHTPMTPSSKYDFQRL